MSPVEQSIGQNGETLAKVMEEAREAHKGISTPNFPKLLLHGRTQRLTATPAPETARAARA